MSSHGLDYRQEAVHPERSSPQGRGLDVFASSQRHNEEIAQRVSLAEIASGLRAVQGFCRQKGINDIENACNTLIDYIESKTKGTERETNEDPNTAAHQTIGFLEDKVTGPSTNSIYFLAEHMKREIHLFPPQAQQEVAQAPSLSPDTAPAHHLGKMLTPSSFQGPSSSQRPSDTALQQTDSLESVRTINIRKLVNALVASAGSRISLREYDKDLYKEFNKTDGKPLNSIELDQAYDFLDEHRLRPSLEPYEISNLRDRLKTYFIADD